MRRAVRCCFAAWFAAPRATTLSLALAATLALSGCGAVRTIAGVNTLRLHDARVDAMEVEIGSGARVICPRQPLQMHVAASAQWPGQAAPATYDTWRGAPGMRRNGKLDFADFAFASEQGRFDEWGWFEPNPDILATVDSGFTIATQLLHPVAQLSQRQHYDADYSCIVSVGAPGAPGRAGSDGSDGASGSSGGSGQRGSEGGWGESGGPGGNGYDGPRLQVYATYVRTQRHPKLLAVRVRGDMNDFVLAPADRPLALVARGGQGGRGGAGGAGGEGGSGGSASDDRNGGQGGSGGDGGQGGSGGDGGVGGNGGAIELIYDARYPELAAQLLLDVDGGLPGEGGTAGSSGRGGFGGSGNGGSGGSGNSGNSGNYGRYGSAGQAGRADASAGEVARYFRSVPGIELLPGRQR